MKRATSPPVLFYDPTSEPCRAVHWFALEAGIPLELRTTWLARGEHRSAELLAVNPCHQVPALRHGDFNLAEASAIMLYLADVHYQNERWLGDRPTERATVHRLLSWYHTNLRQKLTYDYSLPVLFLPYYRGQRRPELKQRQALREAFNETLEQLEAFVTINPFLAGHRSSLADFLFAPELTALDIDPDSERILEPFAATRAWLARLRQLPSYDQSHRKWNAVAPLLRERLARGVAGPPDLSWIDRP